MACFCRKSSVSCWLTVEKTSVCSHLLTLAAEIPPALPLSPFRPAWHPPDLRKCLPPSPFYSSKVHSARHFGQCPRPRHNLLRAEIARKHSKTHVFHLFLGQSKQIPSRLPPFQSLATSLALIAAAPGLRLVEALPAARQPLVAAPHLAAVGARQLCVELRKPLRHGAALLRRPAAQLREPLAARKAQQLLGRQAHQPRAKVLRLRKSQKQITQVENGPKHRFLHDLSRATRQASICITPRGAHLSHTNRSIHMDVLGVAVP